MRYRGDDRRRSGGFFEEGKGFPPSSRSTLPEVDSPFTQPQDWSYSASAGSVWAPGFPPRLALSPFPVRSGFVLYGFGVIREGGCWNASAIPAWARIKSFVGVPAC